MLLQGVRYFCFVYRPDGLVPISPGSPSCNCARPPLRPANMTPQPTTTSLLELLLGTQLVAVAAFPLPAVGSSGGETGLSCSLATTRWMGLGLAWESLHSTCGRSSCRSWFSRPEPSETAR